MGLGCYDNCKTFLQEEKKDEIKKDGIIIKKMEKKVSFDSDELIKPRGNNPSGGFFGNFNNSDQKKKGILKPPSPRNNDNKMNNIIKDINFSSNLDSQNKNLDKNDFIDTNKNLTNNIETNNINNEINQPILETKKKRKK